MKKLLFFLTMQTIINFCQDDMQQRKLAAANEPDYQEYTRKQKILRKRQLKELNTAWDKEYNQQTRKSSQKVSFASDVAQRPEFNPLDVDTWDLNTLKKIKKNDLKKLSDEQIIKLIDKPDFLKSLYGEIKSISPYKIHTIDPDLLTKEISDQTMLTILDNQYLRSLFTSEQLKAMEVKMYASITPKEFLAGIFSDQEIGIILDDDDLRSLFSQEQLLAMYIKVHITTLSVAFLKRHLLENPDLLQDLSKQQVQSINLQTLSEALYYKLPDQLDLDFVQKLSDEQITQMYDDHMNWHLNIFKNRGTKFQQNFTSDAWEYVERVATSLHIPGFSY